jgi:drug/metabolite transporter (DMT)-like permease
MATRPAHRGYSAALAAALIWALIPVGTRFYVLRVDPYLFNVIRFAASACGALPLFVRARPWRWPARDLRLVAACAFFGVSGYNIPVALGAQTTPAGALGLLIATESVMIVALTMLLRRRPIHRRIVVGSVIALLGVVLTSGVLTAPGVQWVGTSEVLVGAFSWSLYTVLVVRLNQRYGSLAVTGTILVFGTAMLMAVSLPQVHSGMLPDAASIAILAGMGVASSLLGFLLWNYAGTVVPTERLGLFVYLIPVASVCAGVAFLKESLNLPILSGGALTVVGVWIASRTTSLRESARSCRCDVSVETPAARRRCP